MLFLVLRNESLRIGKNGEICGQMHFMRDKGGTGNLSKVSEKSAVSPSMSISIAVKIQLLLKIKIYMKTN